MKPEQAREAIRSGYARVRMAFVGDICLAGGLQASLRDRGPGYPFPGAGDAFGPADLVVGNLECCVEDRQRVDERPPNIMVVSEKLAEGLLQSGVTVVSLANNHILDGGAEGLASTMRFLDRHGIHHFGAGSDAGAAEKPLIIERNGLKIALLAACDDTGVWASTQRAGVPPMTSTRLRARVAAVRGAAQIVIVILHADLEFTAYPSPSRVRLSRGLVDSGADLVIQHHPHVSQGIEMHGDGLIAYSLGNYIFFVEGNQYFLREPATRWGLVLHVEVEMVDGRVRIAHEPRPVTIDSTNRTLLSAGSAREEQLLELERISTHLRSASRLRRERFQRCVQEARSTFYGLYYLGRKKGLREMLRSGRRLLASPHERRWVYSLLSGGRFG